MKKRDYLVLLLIGIILISLYSISAQSNITEQSAISKIWEPVKVNFLKFSTFTSNKLGVLFGFRSFNKDNLSNNYFSGFSEYMSSNFLYYLAFIVLVIFLMYIFHLIEFISFLPKDMVGIKGVTKDFFKSNKIQIFILILFLFFIGVPLINRILQIITLEVLGVGLFIRALIISSILYFLPEFAKRYAEYRKRNYEYKEKLGKIAGEEMLKTISSG